MFFTQWNTPWGVSLYEKSFFGKRVTKWGYFELLCISKSASYHNTIDNRDPGPLGLQEYYRLSTVLITQHHTRTQWPPQFHVSINKKKKIKKKKKEKQHKHQHSVFAHKLLTSPFIFYPTFQLFEFLYIKTVLQLSYPPFVRINLWKRLKNEFPDRSSRVTVLFKLETIFTFKAVVLDGEFKSPASLCLSACKMYVDKIDNLPTFNSNSNRSCVF